MYMLYLDNAGVTPYIGTCSFLKATKDDDGTSLVVLGDCSGTIEIVFPSSKVPELEPLSIPATGVPLVFYGGSSNGVPTPVGLRLHTGSSTLTAIPPVFCPETHVQFHKELMTLLAHHVTDERCKKLLLDVLTDDYLAPQFQTVPASNQCHHTEEGGLLRHTLEVVKEVLASPTWNSWDDGMKSLALTVAALHDIGKCHNRLAAFHFWAIGHEERALELIAQPMQAFEETWPEGAELLRLCLIHKPLGNAENPIRVLVKSADRVSATNDAFIKSFEGVEEWKSVVKAEGSNHRTYYRAT